MTRTPKTNANWTPTGLQGSVISHLRPRAGWAFSLPASSPQSTRHTLRPRFSVRSQSGLCHAPSSHTPTSPAFFFSFRPLTSRFQKPRDAIGGLLRSEEHTSELQSLRHLVCRLLLEKKKKIKTKKSYI